MTQDLFERLYHEVRAEAVQHGISRAKVSRVFMDAYQEHKNQHGSFKNHPEYTTAMTGRYLYMHDKAMKYIQEHKNEKK